MSAGVWWSLEDYATLRPNLEVEHFGLFTPDETARPVAASAKTTFTGVPLRLEARSPGLPVPRVNPPDVASTPSGQLLLAYLGYGLVVAFALLATALVVMVARGGASRLLQRTSGARR